MIGLRKTIGAISKIGVLLLFLCALFGPAPASADEDLGPQPPGAFDFYVLSLTWVPGFCARHSDPQECAGDIGFALHGLWPESRSGYPSNCANEELPAQTRSEFVDLFPSAGMIDHEWLKHGTCTGLGPRDYFETTREIRAAIHIPPEFQKSVALRPADGGTIKARFIADNPSLRENDLVLVCSHAVVVELHVCVGKDGSPRACEAWERAEERCE
jgi:ribonuclease T2